MPTFASAANSGVGPQGLAVQCDPNYKVDRPQTMVIDATMVIRVVLLLTDEFHGAATGPPSVVDQESGLRFGVPKHLARPFTAAWTSTVPRGRIGFAMN